MQQLIHHLPFSPLPESPPVFSRALLRENLIPALSRPSSWAQAVLTPGAWWQYPIPLGPPPACPVSGETQVQKWVWLFSDAGFSTSFHSISGLVTGCASVSLWGVQHWEGNYPTLPGSDKGSVAM